MTLLLSRQEIEGLVSTDAGIAAVESIHLDLGLGLMEQPAPVALVSAADDAVFLPMTARSDRLGIAIVKLMADIPHNAALGEPTQRSTVLAMSTTTGQTIAVLDGAAITRQRTAAASAVATRHLARGAGGVLGLIGAGNLAVEHVAAIAAVRPIDRIVVWSRTATTASRFVERIRMAGFDLPVVHADSPEAVVRAADVVCTLTPSREPIVRGEWLRPGQHINAVGAPPRPTHREIDGAGMARARLVIDSAPTTLSKSGDVLLALDEGFLLPADPLLELGTVVAGLAPGRVTDADITLFNSVGIAAQDLALTALVLDAAATRQAGTELPAAREAQLAGRRGLTRIAVINCNTTATMTEAIVAQARRTAASGTTIVGVTPTWGVPSAEGWYDSFLSAAAVLDAISTLPPDIDGIVMAGFGEHGREGARELADVPVIDITEAAVHAAMPLGRRYGVVTTLDRATGLIEDSLLTAGLLAHCAGVAGTGLGVLELEADPERTAAAFVLAAQRLVDQGAEVICLGCAGMAGLEATVRAALDVPVVDGVAAAIAQVETLHRLGLGTSRIGTYARPLAKARSLRPAATRSPGVIGLSGRSGRPG